MISKQIVEWVDASRTGHELLRLNRTTEGIVADGTITDSSDTNYSLIYHIECDEQWRTKSVDITSNRNDRAIHLRSDCNGHWSTEAGEALPILAGIIDVDISATPFSNTLPVRRLKLNIGESADISTVYIDVAEMRFVVDPQRYTRLSEYVYRYDSRDSDFTRDLLVDDERLIIDYPGLFRRI